MSQEQIVRAWKDAAYRETLTAEQLAQVPANPAGLIELTDEALEGVLAGRSNNGSCVLLSCW